MPPASREEINDDMPSVSSANPNRPQRRRKKSKLPITRQQLNLNFKKKFKNILNGVHNDLSLTANTVCILNSLVNDIFDRLMDQAIRFQRVSKRKSLTHLDIAAACRVLLPGSLQSQAMMEGTKAVIHYKNQTSRK